MWKNAQNIDGLGRILQYMGDFRRQARVKKTKNLSSRQKDMGKTMSRYWAAALVVYVMALFQASAQDVNITPEIKSFSARINGQLIQIDRIQDTSHRVTSEFAKTSRPCPPFCIHPISAAPGVETLGEIELMDFISSEVAGKTGLVVDNRVPEWFAKGTIPGAVNIPFNTLEQSNPYRAQIFQALGAVQAEEGWNFEGALDLALFCNGPWCDQSPRAIRDLIEAGYPPEKLRYYRGGMQMWVLLGLTVKTPNT